MHDDDRLLGEFRRRIQLGDRRIVPRLDVTEEDLRQGIAVEFEVAGLHAFKIDNRHVAADHGRKLNQPRLGQICRLQRHVGCAERHRLGLDLLDPTAGTDRLVVHPVTGLFLVGIGPLRIDRERERRTRSGNVGGKRRRRCGDQAGSDDYLDEIHGMVSIW